MIKSEITLFGSPILTTNDIFLFSNSAFNSLIDSKINDALKAFIFGNPRLLFINNFESKQYIPNNLFEFLEAFANPLWSEIRRSFRNQTKDLTPSTSFTAVFNIFPIFFPLLSPIKTQAAFNAYFSW